MLSVGSRTVKTVFSLCLRKKFVSPCTALKTNFPFANSFARAESARAALKQRSGKCGQLGLTNCFGKASKTALSVPAPVIRFASHK